MIKKRISKFFSSLTQNQSEPIIFVHGGADDIPPELVPLKLEGVKKAAEIGYKTLKCGGTAIDAVEAAIKYMESDPSFNAGYGSVLNIDGNIEMDACIMSGLDLKTGAVSAVSDIAHPISLSRVIMEKTPHIRFAGESAKKLAEKHGLQIVVPETLITDYNKNLLKEFKEKNQNKGGGTVGAVALDTGGNLAAGTSTGGLVGKMCGRCGDTSLVGCGTYADNETGAVSMTGHGESIIKLCMAHSIVKEIERGKTPQNAAQDIFKVMSKRLRNTGGTIVISKSGDLGVWFTSERMPWAYIQGSKLHSGINRNEHNVDCFQHT